MSGPVWGLLVAVYQLLTMCLHITYTLLTSCYACRIDNQMCGEPSWGCWWEPIRKPCLVSNMNAITLKLVIGFIV